MEKLTFAIYLQFTVTVREKHLHRLSQTVLKTVQIRISLVVKYQTAATVVGATQLPSELPLDLYLFIL